MTPYIAAQRLAKTFGRKRVLDHGQSELGRAAQSDSIPGRFHVSTDEGGIFVLADCKNKKEPRRQAGLSLCIHGTGSRDAFITRPMNPLWLFSAGAMYSTVEDMQKWGEALRRSILLPRDTLEQMWKP